MALGTYFLTGLRLLLAVIFGASALAKLVDRGSFRTALADFAVPEVLQSPASILIPILEIVVGVGLLLAASAWPAAISALGLLLIFTAAIIANLVRGKTPECHCFGQLSSAPVSWRTVLRNGILIAAASALVIYGRTGPGPNLVGWVSRLTLPEALGLAAFVLIVALVSIETWVLANVLRQNGRLLLRLDSLEAALTSGERRPAPHSRQRVGETRPGLPVGSRAPVFRLERVGGGTMTTAKLLAARKPLALAFLDPDCGPCKALLPDLVQWERELADQVTLAVISSRSKDANNRKIGGHGLTHVLVQKNREVSEAYQAFGTPSMVVIEPDGAIGSPVAPGRDAIRELIARFAAGQLHRSHTSRVSDPVMRSGSNGADGGMLEGKSRIGQVAPDVRLPDLRGEQINLTAFRGHPTLVLFWNPGCGFCQRMLGDLKTWEATRSDTSPQLLVISTGSVEANRAMGLRGHVALDVGFETGRAFGAGGTPSAVVVDKDGQIASDVAVGAAAVLALAARGVTVLRAGV